MSEFFKPKWVFWIQLIIENMNITKSQYTEVFIIVCMGILNEIMYTWTQLLILTHLCKRTIILICVSVFLSRSVLEMQEQHHVYYFFSPIEFPKICVLKCQDCRTGRKETKEQTLAKWPLYVFLKSLLPKALLTPNI